MVKRWYPGDDILQAGLYDLSRGELRADASLREQSYTTYSKKPFLMSFTEQSQQEVLSDANQATDACREIFLVFLQHLTSTEGGVGDMASFVRTFLADTAEVVEEHAGSVKSELRQTEAEVQDGKRDPLGRERREEDESLDTRQRFERGMDTAKTAGSNIIGGTQAVKGSADQLSGKAAQDLDRVFENVRFQNIYI